MHTSKPLPSPRWTRPVLVAAMTSLGVVAGQAPGADNTGVGFPLDASLMAAPSAPAPTLKPGTTSGTLVVDGKTIPLKHVYASRQILPALEAPEWSLEQRRRIVLVFSDVELPAELRHDGDALPAASLAGKLRGATFLIHPRIAKSRSIKILHPITPQSAALGITAGNMQDGGGDLVLTDLRVDADAISGVIEMTKPFDVSSNFVVEPGMPASIQVMRTPFHARLEAVPPPVELDGTAAAKTAPFEAFARFNELGLKGEVATLRGLLSEDLDRMMGPMMEQIPPEEFKSQFHPVDTLRKAIAGSATVGNRAILAFRVAVLRPEMAGEAGDRTQNIQLIQVGGRWKVAEM